MLTIVYTCVLVIVLYNSSIKCFHHTKSVAKKSLIRKELLCYEALKSFQKVT